MVKKDNINYDFHVNATLNVSDLELLFESAFKKKPKPGYFDWKYKSSPDGNVIHATAWHEGQLVGFYGILPETLILDNQKYHCFQSMDTMVHTKHVGKGLFIKLAKLCYANVEFDADIFAFTGANSTPGFLKHLNFACRTKVQWMYGFPTLIKAKSFFSNKLKIEITEKFSFDKNFDSYLEKRNINNIIERDLSSKKMNWRGFQHPDRDYHLHYFISQEEIIGFCVLSNSKTRITTVEYMDFKDDAFLNYIPQIILKLGDWHNTKYFKCYEAKSSRISYGKYGFIRNPLPKGPFRSTVNFILRKVELERKIYQSEQVKKLDIQPLMRD